MTPDPPTFKFLPKPRPPSITAAPVMVLSDSVVSSTSNRPAMTPYPPILIFSSIPTPPSTTRAPVSLSVLEVAPSIVTSAPTFKFKPTPTPPAITTAPVVILSESVASVKSD